MKKSLKNVTVALITIMVAILSAIFLMIVITNSNLDVPISSIESDTSFEVETDISEEKPRQDASEAHISTLTSTPTPSKPQNQPSSSSLPTATSNSGTLSSGGNKVLHPTSGLPFKDRANPETGLSWDGVSPIIYTYPDGTTGTEKRDGATYEYLPGMYTTVTIIRDDGGREFNSSCTNCGRKVTADKDGCWYYNYSHYCNYCGILISDMTCHYCPSNSSNTPRYCNHCGKVGGYGTNGTCLRYSFGSHECVNCGEFVPEDTCHTCTKGCRYCGKPMGNGTNETCYRDYFNPTNCPSCGASVPTNTCHNCQ